MESTVPCRLVIESEENRGMIFRLRERSVTIGRGPQNTVQIIDTRMSRVHARLDRESAGWTIRNLQSKNGIMVNARTLHNAARLSPGDQIHIGNTVFTFEPDILPPEEESEGRDNSSVKVVDDGSHAMETSQILELPIEEDEREITASGVPPGGEERLRSIYKIGKLIQSILGLDELLNKVMEIVCQVLRPTQACIMLYDKKQKGLVPRVVRKPADASADVIISGSIIHQAMEDRVAVLMSGEDADARLRKADSVVAHRIESAICAPLISKGEVLGALYLDVRGGGRLYTDGDLQWAAGVAGQAALAIAISLLHAENLSKREREKEMEIARTIQMNLLPKSMPKIPNFEFGGISEPARMVGGDYFDIIDLQNGNYALTIADVSGKGVPAALLLASFRSAFRMEIRNLNDPEKLIEIVDRLNETVCQDTMNNMFITMVLGYFEPAERRLTYCNAGHAYPIIRMPDGDLVNLDKGGSFLGIMPGINYESGSVTLPEGSMVVFVTDGIADALNPAGEAFDDERLREFIQAFSDQSAQGFCDELQKAVDKFRGDAEQFDDLTAMVLRAL